MRAARERSRAIDKVLVTCAACGAFNRVPLERLGQAGRCGACRADLPARGFHADAPIEVGESRFDAVTRLSSLPVLVDFWAAWCAPCRTLAPALEQMARDLAGRLLVVKVDTENAPMIAARFGVQAVPTLLILRSGLEVDRMTGALPLPALRARVERFLD
jgi:thioredoxin 2